MERQEYYKYIGDVMVRSYCTSLNIDGHWVSNPTEEMILADGWLPYTPPEPEPYVPQPQDEPYEYNVLEAVKTMFADQVRDMSDKQALDVAALFPTWHSLIGQQVAAGERIWDDGKLWKVLQPHTVSAEWRPAEAVSLYVEVSIAEWPEYRQPTGAHDAYNTGDKVTFEGHHYICKLDGTTFSPAGYSAAWELVE